MSQLAAGVFFAAAALIQLGLGSALIVRRRRNEALILLGVLFLLNGVYSAVAVIPTGFGHPYDPEDTEAPLNRVFFSTDFLTTFLILWLALVYPHRPRLLERRPWVLPLALGVFAFFILTDYAILPHDQLYGECNDGGCATVFSFLAYAGLPDLVFPILLVRWSRHLVRMDSPAQRREFMWVFAAFAIRGTHVATSFPIDTFASGFATSGIATWFRLSYTLVNAACLAAVAGCIAFLALHRRRMGSEGQRGVELVLLFMLLGLGVTVAGGFVHLDATVSSDYFLNPVTSLDFLVVRPALVVMAFLHTELAGAWLRPRRVGTALAGALGFGVFLVPADGHLGGAGAGHWAAAVSLAAVLAASVALLVWTLLRERDVSARRRSVDRFVTLLEDLHRGGPPSAAGLARVEAERLALGIPSGQAEALAHAVQERWAGDPTKPWLPGDTVKGRYTLERLLGAGGMGQAWLAHDAVEAQRVVLKRTTGLDEASRRALLQESAALQKLRHPRVIRLLRTEVVGREPILVLEFAPGGSLATHLQRRRPSRAEALRLADDLLAGLQAAHTAGLVHGDVKPANVLLAADGSARLCDFGLAAAPPPEASLVDATRGPAGSVRYLAPEQVAGQPATPRSDAYSAALTIAEMLVGAPLVPDGLDDFRTRQAVLKGPRLDAVPAGPRALLQRALERDPARRPTLAELRRDLAALGPPQTPRARASSGRSHKALRA